MSKSYWAPVKATLRKIRSLLVRPKSPKSATFLAANGKVYPRGPSGYVPDSAERLRRKGACPPGERRGFLNALANLLGGGRAPDGRIIGTAGRLRLRKRRVRPKRRPAPPPSRTKPSAAAKRSKARATSTGGET